MSTWDPDGVHRAGSGDEPTFTERPGKRKLRWREQDEAVRKLPHADQYARGYKDGKIAAEAQLAILEADLLALRLQLAEAQINMREKYAQGFEDGKAEAGEWNLT